MSRTTREAVRKHIASPLAVVFSDIPVAARYDHQPSDFGGADVALVVTSDGTKQEMRSFSADNATYRIEVQLWVARTRFQTGSSQIDTGWGPNDTEDALDELSEKLVEWASTAAVKGQVDGKWMSLSMADVSSSQVVAVGGRAYKFEVFPLEVKV